MKELRNNQDIVIRADKGNATVVMNKSDYNERIKTLLDPDHHRKPTGDPTARIERLSKEFSTERERVS